jgi:hypothetical protein
MLIITDNNGNITSFLWNKDKSIVGLNSFFEIDEIEDNRNILDTFSKSLPPYNDYTINNGNLLYKNAIITIAKDQNKSDFLNEYNLAIDTLSSHINESAWTNSKIINAVVIHARILLFIVKLMRRLI